MHHKFLCFVIFRLLWIQLGTSKKALMMFQRAWILLADCPKMCPAKHIHTWHSVGNEMAWRPLEPNQTAGTCWTRLAVHPSWVANSGWSTNPQPTTAAQRSTSINSTASPSSEVKIFSTTRIVPPTDASSSFSAGNGKNLVFSLERIQIFGFRFRACRRSAFVGWRRRILPGQLFRMIIRIACLKAVAASWCLSLLGHNESILKSHHNPASFFLSAIDNAAAYAFREKFVGRENTADVVTFICWVAESSCCEVLHRVKLILSYTTAQQQLDFFTNDCAQSFASSERFQRLVWTVLGCSHQ